MVSHEDDRTPECIKPGCSADTNLRIIVWSGDLDRKTMAKARARGEKFRTYLPTVGYECLTCRGTYHHKVPWTFRPASAFFGRNEPETSIGDLIHQGVPVDQLTRKTPTSPVPIAPAPAPEPPAPEPREHAVVVRREDGKYDYAAPTCPRCGDQWIQIIDWLRPNHNRPKAEVRYSCHHCDRSFIAFAPNDWRPPSGWLPAFA